MPVLKYWDATQGAYVTVDAYPSVAYTQVAATAPPANNPTVAPPQGLLWLDTSTGAVASTPYYPPQTPPASGFNSFTDSSGEVWISRNGTPWKRARDGLRGRVYRNAAYTIPTGSTPNFPFDTVSRDPYAMWTPASSVFTVPIPGVYLVTSQIVANITVDAGWANNYLFQSGTQVIWTGNAAPNAGAYVVVAVTDRLACVAGDTIYSQTNCSAAWAAVVGLSFCFLTVDYLGTG